MGNKKQQTYIANTNANQQPIRKHNSKPNDLSLVKFSIFL
ncbi:hypothetical protein AN1V17_51760 [Vallitalea sediminicola]